MDRSRTCVIVAVAVMMTGVFAATMPAQQPAPLETELLTEVRLLRQTMESLMGTNTRVQIVFGRLQLQDQRTATAERRLDDARSNLAAVVSQNSQLSDRAKELEDALGDTGRKPEEFEALRQELVAVRRELTRIEAERLRLQGEEAEIAVTLSQEQARSADLNRRIDELERALAPKP
jgi:chromosome segregation ATPase